MKKARKFVYLSLYFMLVVTCFSIGIFAMTNQTVNSYYAIYYTYTPPTLDKTLLQEKLTANATITEVYFDKFDTEERTSFTDIETFQTADFTLLGDVSENQDESILAYTDVDATKMYVLCTEKITFPVDSGSMFQGFSSLTKIQFENIDTKNVTSLYHMFYGCSSLTSLDLAAFNTPSLTRIASMFYNCSSLTSLTFPSTFDTSKVTSMASLFYGCSSLTSLDLSMFDTTSTASMAGMFYNCAKLVNLDISNFNTSSVTSMNEMFTTCSSLVALNLSHFDTSKVQNMYYMFRNCYKLESLDISSFDTSSMDTGTYQMGFNCMFHSCSKLTYLDLSHFNTKTVTNMAMMFLNCSKLTSLDISSFDTSNVTTMAGMFHGAGLTTLDLSHFNTSKVTDMHQMFYGNALQAVDISSFNTSKVTKMAYMFRGGSASKPLTSIYVGDGWTTDALSTTEVSTLSYGKAVGDTGMFMNCTNLPNWSTNGGVTDKTYAYAGGDGRGYLKYRPTLSLSAVQDTVVAAGDTDLIVGQKPTTISGTPVDISEEGDGIYYYSDGTTGYIYADCKIIFPENCSEMFSGAPYSSIEFVNVDTSNVKNMVAMFMNCINLIGIDVSMFDTSNVTDMRHMFNGCNNVQVIDCSTFNTSNVTEMGYMFSGCYDLVWLDLASFNTSNVRGMLYMFSQCRSIESLDLQSFNTSSVQEVQWMFTGCSSLTLIFVSDGWNLSAVTSGTGMFSGATQLPNYSEDYTSHQYASRYLAYV